jgi:hypothetical protein
MRYFLDTEFDENGSTIKLISIGMVREDGDTLYMVSADFDPADCNEWVQANVLPLLGDAPRFPRETIRDAVRAFIGDDPKPEIWGYFADYDWVVFCQLWGRMVDLPKGFPMFCMDIKQWAKQRGVDIKSAVPQQTGSHNALVDAHWNQRAYNFLLALRSPDEVG